MGEYGQQINAVANGGTANVYVIEEFLAPEWFP
jgi:hypothetical protein